MRDYFKKISELLFNNLESNEILILNIDAEKTDFIRFNHAKIRQAGNVNQVTLTLTMIFKRKTLTSIIRLSTDFKKDSLLLRRTYCRLVLILMHERAKNFIYGHGPICITLSL